MKESLKRLIAAGAARRERKRQREARIERRIALRDALDTLGIETIEANYEGHDGAGNVLKVVSDPPDRLPDAVLSLVKDLVWETASAEHPGFQKDDGADGYFKWYLNKDHIALDHYSTVDGHHFGVHVDREHLDQKIRSDPDVVARTKGKVLAEAGIDPDQLDAILGLERARPNDKGEERPGMAADLGMSGPSP